MRRTLFHSGRVLTQVNGLTADSMAVEKNQIVAIGTNLHNDPRFRSYAHFDLKGKTIIPGLVDAHAHVWYWALTLGRVSLHGCTSIEVCLKQITAFARNLPKGAWVVGTGYAPDSFSQRIEPDRYMLDKAASGRPAFIYSKDEHTAWVNSKALELAGISSRTTDPNGGRIERLTNGEPSGLLREGPAFMLVYRLVAKPSDREMNRWWASARDRAWRRGVTGVHSFDGPDAFGFLERLAERKQLGLRLNMYPRVECLGDLEKAKVSYGQGTPFFRLAGIKIFADGALGSQTALCFHKYRGSKNNIGIEVTTNSELQRQVRRAARLGFPCAIHAIGDKAVANVLDVLQTAPQLPPGRRHRIEHVQLIRRTDIARFKKLGVVASMQPSHCAADVQMVQKYWAGQAKNAYLFRSLAEAGIPQAFGSDCPIEPLDPLAGMAAAVRRVPRNSRAQFFPKESLTAAAALYGFTVGPAIASGEEDSRGYLLPGYPADFVILPSDPTTVPATRLYDMPVLATVLDGEPVFADASLSL